jgi:hypothetical protein
MAAITIEDGVITMRGPRCIPSDKKPASATVTTGPNVWPPSVEFVKRIELPIPQVTPTRSPEMTACGCRYVCAACGSIVTGSDAALRTNEARIVDGIDRIAARKPVLEAACQRAHPLDAMSFKCERHTGAGCFVWSRTVEDDVAITGYLQMRFGQPSLIVPDSSWQQLPARLNFHFIAQIENG